LAEQSALGRLDAWITEQFEGKSSVELPQIASDGYATFVDDVPFMRALYGQQLRTLIYDRAKTLFARSRKGAVALGGTMVDGEEFAKRAERTRKKWAEWKLHAGEAVYKLMDMNRIQLLTAAAEFEAQADASYKRASFVRELADGLRGKETVGVRFKPEEIEAVYVRVYGTKPNDITKEAA
jgi:hypothetical protein